MSEELYKQMAQSIIEGEKETAIELAQKSIELNMHPLDTITNGFVVGVNYIGDQFGKGEETSWERIIFTTKNAKDIYLVISSEARNLCSGRFKISPRLHSSK